MANIANIVNFFLISANICLFLREGPEGAKRDGSAVLNLEIVAGQHPAILATQMHCAALAVAPNLAAGTFILFHPAAVTVYLETAVPYLPEIIGMHVALVVVAAHAQTARYGAVIKDGGYAHTCNATEKVVTNHTLIRTHESLA